MDLGGRLRGAEPAADNHAVCDPVEAVPGVPLPTWRAGKPTGGRKPPIAPIAADGFGQTRMQGKAAPRQGLERGPVAPVERQEAAGLAGGGAGDPRALDDNRLDPAATQEI